MCLAHLETKRAASRTRSRRIYRERVETGDCYRCGKHRVGPPGTSKMCTRCTPMAWCERNPASAREHDAKRIGGAYHKRPRRRRLHQVRNRPAAEARAKCQPCLVAATATSKPGCTASRKPTRLAGPRPASGSRCRPRYYLADGERVLGPYRTAQEAAADRHFRRREGEIVNNRPRPGTHGEGAHRLLPFLPLQPWSRHGSSP